MFEQAIAGVFVMEWWVVLLLAAGLVLTIVEMFLPGFGVAGVTGGILLIIGVLFGSTTVLEGLLLLMMLVLVLGIALFVAMAMMAKGPLWKSPIILHSAENKEEGFSSAEALQYFLGKEGVAETDLRPAGTGKFEGVRLDVVTDSEFVDKGQPIVITKVAGRRIVVKIAQVEIEDQPQG